MPANEHATTSDPKGFPDFGRYNSNLMGASIGGPIVKDKLFFSGSWESDHLRPETLTVSTVPTAGLLAGKL